MEEKEQQVLIMVQGLDKARAGVVKMAAQWTSCWTSVCPPKIVRRLRRCGRFAKLMESEKVASTLTSAWPPALARRCATRSTSASQSTPARNTTSVELGKFVLSHQPVKSLASRSSSAPPSSAGATWIVKGSEGWSRCARRRVAREPV